MWLAWPGEEFDDGGVVGWDPVPLDPQLPLIEPKPLTEGLQIFSVIDKPSNHQTPTDADFQNTPLEDTRNKNNRGLLNPTSAGTAGTASNHGARPSVDGE